MNVPALAEQILRDVCWPDQWLRQPDGSYLPVLPSAEAVQAALRVLAASAAPEATRRAGEEGAG